MTDLPLWVRVSGAGFCLLLVVWALVVLNNIAFFVGRSTGPSVWFAPKDFKCPTCGHVHEPFAPHEPMIEVPPPNDGILGLR